MHTPQYYNIQQLELRYDYTTGILLKPTMYHHYSNWSTKKTIADYNSDQMKGKSKYSNQQYIPVSFKFTISCSCNRALH